MQQQDVWSRAADMYVKIDAGGAHELARCSIGPNMRYGGPLLLRGHECVARMARFKVCASALGSAI